MKHTPGPWASNCFLVVAPKIPEGNYGGREICHTGQGRGSSEECEANATLIAAAPDLLAACQFVMQKIEECMAEMKAAGQNPSIKDREEVAIIQAAIDKATGQ